MTDEKSNNIPIIDAAMEAEERAFLVGDNWFDVDVEPWRLDFQKQYEAPRYTLSWRGVPFAPLGGIHAITGQAGNGKTMTLAQFMAALLNGEFGSLRYELSDEVKHPTVLYIDTEMEEANTIAVKNRVMTMCGRDIRSNYDDFIVIMLREMPEMTDAKGTKTPASVMRWRATLKAIWQYKPTAVFIDGLLDVVADFNDNKECQEIIYKCMQVASFYGISVWCCVHQNPGGEKLVGHLGSFLERKVTDIFRTKKEKAEGQATFTVSQLKARGRDVEDWKFQVLPVDNWGRPEQLTPKEPIAGDNVEEVEKWLEEVKDKIEWPATRQTIKEMVIKPHQSNKPKQDADLQMLINKRILIESDIKRKGYFLLTLNEVPF